MFSHRLAVTEVMVVFDQGIEESLLRSAFSIPASPPCCGWPSSVTLSKILAKITRYGIYTFDSIREPDLLFKLTLPPLQRSGRLGG
jgi:hypothetical protein